MQDETQRRVTSLERRARAEAELRAALDRDLADVAERQRTMAGEITAIADTQSQHTQALRLLDKKIDDVELKLGRRLDSVDTRLGSVDTRLDSVGTQLAVVIDMLGERP